jgi:DNA-binding Lrp family transcriptional regulator
MRRGPQRVGVVSRANVLQGRGPFAGIHPNNHIGAAESEHLLDELDLGIIRRMGLAPFLVWPHPPAGLRPAALARALHTSTDTIKRRLAAMRKQGVFHGTKAFPNPRLLGLRTASLHFSMQPGDRRRIAPQQVTEVEGVLGVFDMVGGDRCIDVAYPHDTSLHEIQDRLRSLLGVASSHFVDFATPTPGIELSPLDWRIVRALRSKPDTSLESVAKSLGLSLRTVKRRFDRMVQEGCIDVIGLFDPGVIPGHLVVDLLFHLNPSSGKAELAAVLNAYRSRWVAQWSPPDSRLGALTLVVVAQSARELEDLRREGESLACVRRCDALVLERAVEHWDWIDVELARRGDAEAVMQKAPAPRAQTTAAPRRRR